MCDEEDALMGYWNFRSAKLCSVCFPASTFLPTNAFEKPARKTSNSRGSFSVLLRTKTSEHKKWDDTTMSRKKKASKHRPVSKLRDLQLLLTPMEIPRIVMPRHPRGIDRVYSPRSGVTCASFDGYRHRKTSLPNLFDTPSPTSHGTGFANQQVPGGMDRSCTNWLDKTMVSTLATIWE